jgi:hypothetical protein
MKIPAPPFRSPHSDDASSVTPEWQRWYASATSSISAAPQIVSVPADSNAKGTKGSIAVDENYLYVCHTDNQWARFTKAGW